MHPLITKILWTVIGLNTAALIVLAVAFLVSMSGRNVSTMESGWMAILFIAAVIVILLAAVPLRLGHSTFSLFVSGFFAFMPIVIYLSIFISNHMPRIGRDQTMAEFYFKDPSQRIIAEAIEKGDFRLVTRLIEGKDLNIKGTPGSNGDSLTYLQFAIRLRNDRVSSFQEVPNLTVIRTLIAAGSNPTLALPEGIRCLPPDIIAQLLDAGADPNTHGFVSSDPLLFEAIGRTKQENDIAIQLIRKGALVNPINNEGNTLLMFAANNAGTSERWADTWRMIRYLIEDAKADYTYKRFDGMSFPQIVKSIRERATEENVTMPADFDAVLKIVEKNPGQNTRNALL